jgi:pyruvate formate lyase activating enzyme
MLKSMIVSLIMWHMKTGIVFDIKEFAVHDGPGIRTTVFLKGCALRCSWCHNPEGLSPEPQILHGPFGERLAGTQYSSAELAGLLNRQAGILSENGGGVTFSGGEPLFQSEFVAETINKLNGLHILLDTAGYASKASFERVASRVDMLYLDLKTLEAETFRKYCGGDVEVLLNNLKQLHTLDVQVVIRVPLIPGVTDTLQNMTSIAQTIHDIPGLIRVDLLPYNRLAGAKYPLLGLEYQPGFDESRAPRVFGEPFDALNIPWRLV